MFDLLATLFGCIHQIVIIIIIVIVIVITSWRCVLLMVIYIRARRISRTSKSVGSAGSVKFKPNQFEASVKTTGCERCEKTSDKVGTAEDDGKEERLSKAIEKKQCNATFKVGWRYLSRSMVKDLINEENSTAKETDNASSVEQRQENAQDQDITHEDSFLGVENVELNGNQIESLAKMKSIFVERFASPVAVDSSYEDSLTQVKNEIQIKIEDFAQKFGILDNKCRVTMLELWATKARLQGNMRFRDDLKKATEEFLGEKIDDDEDFKKFCRQVVKLVPEDKWMRFVRLHLSLEEEEIQKFKRRFATFSDEQARQFAKTIRANGVDPAVTGRKLLISVNTAEYAM